MGVTDRSGGKGGRARAGAADGADAQALALS